MNNPILCVESLAGSYENCVRLGIENRIKRELKYFQRTFGSVYYLSKDIKRFQLGNRINHVILPKWTPKPLKNLIYLLYPFFNLNVFRRCDVYFVNNISGSFPAILAKFLLRGKHVISRYDWNWGYTFKQKYSFSIYFMTRILEYICLKSSDLVIASTESLRSDVITITNDKKKRIDIIPNWYDETVFKPAKRELNDKKRPTLISVGRLDDGKNHMLLLKTATKLKSRGSNPEVILVGDGENRNELLNYAEINKISLKIVRRIPNHELPRYLDKVDLFLLTSKYEGLPQAVIEALATGLPVIGTDVRGTKDVIINHHSGILCKENPDALANAIEMLLTDKKKYMQMSRNAVESMKTYSSSVVLKRLMESVKNEAKNNRNHPGL